MLEKECPDDVLCRISAENRWTINKDDHFCNVDNNEACLQQKGCCFVDNECFPKRECPPLQDQGQNL